MSTVKHVCFFFGLGEAVLQQTWRWNSQLKGEEEG